MRNLLIVVVILFLGIFGMYSAFEIPEHLRGHAERLHNKCQGETGVDKDLIAQSNNGILPNDEKLKCYIHCLFRTTGLMDENNIIHLEYMIDILPKEVHEIIERLVSTCGTKHGADPCETAYLTVKCYFETDPVHGMLI